MMTKEKLTEMLKGMCAKKAYKLIHSNGKVIVRVTYQQKEPAIITDVKEA